MHTVEQLLAAADGLCQAVDRLGFAAPVGCVYNPLVYARAVHDEYVRRFGAGPRRVLFLGMNPGPFGMAQTGVPFGEVAAVRDWLGLTGTVLKPKREHPKRPVEGLACRRSEVSGRRLWGLFRDRFGTPAAFFRDHYVANFCPLVFMTGTGANLTPDKLPAAEAAPLYAACDEHLRAVVKALGVEWVVGVGAFAEARAGEALEGAGVRITRVLHPSPASPAANRGWAEVATKELLAARVWR